MTIKESNKLLKEVYDETKERISKQPRVPFFKRLAKIFVGIGGVGGSILATAGIGVSLGIGVIFPIHVILVGSYLAVVGTVGTFVSNLPIEGGLKK